MEHDQNRRQKSMTNSLFNIKARAFVVETPPLDIGVSY